MVINDKEKYIFFHIPKAGGSSITSLLTNNHHKQYPTHITVSELQQEFPNYNNYYTFTFVRNPWDRLYSLYNFICQKRMNVAAGEDWNQDYYKRMGFKWWLLDHEWWPPYDRNKNKLPHQKNPQMNSLKNNDGVIDIAFIGKLENVVTNIKTIGEKIKIRMGVPKLNTTNHIKYTNVYDNEMIDFVNIYHKTDIVEFNYEYGQ